MSRYDGLIIPRSYSDYINKTDAATLLQALQLSGVMDAEPTANSNHPMKSGGLYPLNQKIITLYDYNLLSNVRSLPKIHYSDLPSHSDIDETFFKEWIDYFVANHYFDNPDNVYIAQASPNYSVIVIGYTYGGDAAKTWSAFRYFSPSAGIGRFGYYNGNWYFSAPQ